MRPMWSITFLMLLSLVIESEAVLAQSTEPVDAFDRYILEQMETTRIPGVTVVVAHKGKVLKSRGYGFANIEWEVPASSETVYEISSVTKLFTAVATMMLVEKKALSLDEPISRYLEGVPESHSSITPRHLLTHTAGLEGDYYDTYKLFAPTPLRYTVDAQLADLFAKPPKSRPGTAHEYGDASMFLLGVIIAKVSGMPYEEFIRTRIFEPAGMTHSSFIDASAVVPHRAQEYTLRGTQIVRWSVEQNLQALDGNAFGGILATALDLQLFDESLRTGRLLGLEMKRGMFEVHQLPDGSYGGQGFSRMALGWWIRDDLAGHRCGSHLGHTGTAFFHCPDEDFAVIFLSNLTNGYDFMGDRGVSASVRHGIAERAVDMFLKGKER